jgi:hypothetical protein
MPPSLRSRRSTGRTCWSRWTGRAYSGEFMLGSSGKQAYACVHG